MLYICVGLPGSIFVFSWHFYHQVTPCIYRRALLYICVGLPGSNFSNFDSVHIISFFSIPASCEPVSQIIVNNLTTLSYLLLVSHQKSEIATFCSYSGLSIFIFHISTQYVFNSCLSLSRLFPTFSHTCLHTSTQ